MYIFLQCTMWNAIKSDLLTFAATVQEESTKAVQLVIGEEESEERLKKEDAPGAREGLKRQAITDLTRSFTTYSQVNNGCFPRLLKVSQY